MVTVNMGVPGFGNQKVSYASMTETGKLKLNQHEITGIKAQIANSINNRERACLDEIVKDVQPANPGMTKDNIRDIVNQMWKADYISIH